MLRITAFDDPSTYGGAAWELAKREIATLQSQLAASQERERILREGLEKYAHTGNWSHTEMNCPYRSLWMQWGNGYDIAERAIKAAGEVKG